ncbi:MAG TPA: hypothetical protein VEF76_05960 [Patescibacteria group bacterium]|nr:hypothetical protein [Patescibacteria group bacterium]
MHFPRYTTTDLRRKFKAAAIASTVMFSPLALAAQVQAPVIPESENSAVVVNNAPPPESEPVPLPHRFTPLGAFSPLFSTADERSRNIFFAQTPETIAEYRTLTNSAQRGPLTRAELAAIADIKKAAAPDAKKYKVSLAVAATLHFAARQTVTEFEALVTRLQENSGNVMNVSPARLRGDQIYKFDVSTWLYLMKTHGPQHGMGFFANKIDVSAPLLNAQGQMTVKLFVEDPAVLRQIIAMRTNPRISTLLGAEYVAHEAEVPKTAYKGMNYSFDPQVAAAQTALMTIGFDLGIRGADGVRGPLTTAALKEFTQMSQPLLAPGQTIDQYLQAAARQAVEDSARYATAYDAITPATTFAVRHASKLAGVDFGYLMQLANAESGFDVSVGASTSSATGLFQFIDNTWLASLYTHGAKHGLGDIASKVEVERNAAGEIKKAWISDPLVEKYALGLRTDPRIMALMGAEFAKENRENLQAALPRREITRTDQYLAHFLGSGQAVNFISRLDRNPDAAAKSAFPAAASANHNVFYKRSGVARSLEEVYNLFKQKFNSTFFDAPAPPQPQRVSLPPPRPPGL